MTKKHYALIAEVLERHKASRELCEDMAKELHRASDYDINGNKKFNSHKFLTACGQD